jgi:DNA-binding CsgD family transcriptional regulator
MAQSDELSNREQDVIKHVLEGKSNKEIAAALHISVRTVEFHLKNIYGKLQVASRVELVLKLGSSTGAETAEIAEDRDRFSDWHWAAHLREAVSKFGKELRMQSSLGSNAGGAGGTLSFFDAIRVCLTKYAEFIGRATRPEFWWFTLFVVVVGSALTYLSENVASVFMVLMLLPWLAAGTRRLRDSGNSGWWQLFLLVPVAGFVVVGVLWAQPPAGPLPSESQPTAG